MQMKKWMFLVLSCHFNLLLIGQDKDLSILATAGTTFETPEMSLDWTLGETVIHYYEQPELSLTQGFHQPFYKIVSVNQLSTTTGNINVAPNLFTDAFSIDMRFYEKIHGSISLIRMDGAIIWEKPFEGMNYHENYSGAHLPSGSYLLIVKIESKSFISAYQLMKIQ